MIITNTKHDGQTLRRLGRVATTEEVLTAPDSPLAPPNHARVLRLAVRAFNSSKRPRLPLIVHATSYHSFPPTTQVLRAEGNSTYGDCILPSFQELFRAAAASLGAPSFFRLSSQRRCLLLSFFFRC